MADLPISPEDERRGVPQPLTEAQLNFFIEQQKHAVHKATRRTLRQAFVGYLVLLAGVFGMYQNGQHVSNEENDAVIRSGTVVSVVGCNRDFEAQERIIGLLQRLQEASTASYKQGNVSDAQHATAQAFYNQEIESAQRSLPDCRDAEFTLTDELTNAPFPPQARYPGDGR